MTYQEPSAELRRAANQLKEMYESLQMAGFTRQEAFMMVCEGLKAAMAAGFQGPQDSQE